jgi:CP family cyanate transporter-like MFS transporter
MVALRGGGPSSIRAALIPLLLLWAAGAAIRIPILDVPPVLPLIRAALHMSETQVGLLSGLPLGMFALAAVPGSLLVARFGAVRTLLVGLLITAVASTARSIVPDVLTLYAATLVMGFGISVVQPALPPLVRDWLPTRIGLGTAVTTNGYLIGSTLTTGLMLPLIMPLMGQSWRLGLAVWNIPIAIAVLLVWWLAPPEHAPAPGVAAADRKWMPDWKSPLVWLLGLTLGANTSVFFGLNAFLPERLHEIGRADLISPALFWLNALQLLSSFVLLLVADRLQRSVWSYLLFGPLAIVGMLGIMFADGYWIVVAASLVGVGLAVTFVVVLAQPPVLCPADQVHHVAAGMFAIGYTIGIVLPVVSGALWDLTGISRMAFVPFLVMLVVLAAAGAMLMRHPRLSDA